MSDIGPALGTAYSSSWAVVIGIDDYQHAPKLSAAANDARAFAGLLVRRLGFEYANVRLLLDQSASRDAIMDAFGRLVDDGPDHDSRVVFYFAGHGMTRSGIRGSDGYLVPCEGNYQKLGSVIRWDELVRTSDLIPAKHCAFFVDACYGGLVFQRAAPRASHRFVRDMMTRYGRQAIASGKADQTVSDGGGPRPDHSVFTGHLLDALEHDKMVDSAVLSASAVMAYVADRTANDLDSRQTPHYGFVSGDGDMILHPSSAGLADAVPAHESGEMVVVHEGTGGRTAQQNDDGHAQKVKSLLPDQANEIVLNDLIQDELRSALAVLEETENRFPTSSFGTEEIVPRIEGYEASMDPLCETVILSARWGSHWSLKALELPMVRIAERIQSRAGYSAAVGLRWHPSQVLFYSSMVAALAGDRWDSAHALMNMKLTPSDSWENENTLSGRLVRGVLETERSGVFKSVPGHEKHLVARSEYLFRALQPRIEEQLFLGERYEALFDTAEVVLALHYADKEAEAGRRPWGPVGRFAWKERTPWQDKPFRELTTALLENAKHQALQAGFFGGSQVRAQRVSSAYRDLIDSLPWM